MSHQPNKKPAGREALGKGIRSLLQTIDTDLKSNPLPVKDAKPIPVSGIERIPLEQIKANPEQPRRDFNQQALDELTQSIKLHDVIQPITVIRTGTHAYKLISGERRLRAAKAAGLKDIPAYIRQANEETVLELALLENLQREDLNAIEIALSLKRLLEECNFTQEQLSSRISKDRSTITNYIRLLKLPPDIQVSVRNGTLSMGHARALISVDTVDKQLYLFAQIIKNHLSVRQTEALVRKLDHVGKTPAAITAKNTLSPSLKKIEDGLASHFSTKVKLSRDKKGKGNIVIEFYSDEELNHILELIEQ